MDKMRATVFSVIAVAIVVGASISLNYVTLDSGTFSPLPANRTGVIPVQDNGNNNTTNTVSNGGTDGTFTVLPSENLPEISDSRLKVEKVIEGLDLPTSMTFIGLDDILILEKESGAVRLVSNGQLQEEPVLELAVESDSERGLLGIAVQDNNVNGTKTVFLYFTQASGDEVRNRVYKYDLDE